MIQDYYPEHTTHPAHKMMERASLQDMTRAGRKELKKTHTRRSRQYLKRRLRKHEE